MSTSRVTVQLRPATASAAFKPASRSSSSSLSSAERRSVLDSPSPAASGPSVSFVGASASLSSSARLLAAALQQDPSILQYDEAVEAATATAAAARPSRTAAAATAGSDSLSGNSRPAVMVAVARTGSRYIESLVRAASAREAHRSAVQQLARQKEIEREEQMEQFKGKERFITAAYKQQMQQANQWSPQPQQRRHTAQQPQQSQQQPQPDKTEQRPMDEQNSSGGTEVSRVVFAVSEAASKRRRIERASEEAATDDSGQQRLHADDRDSLDSVSLTRSPIPLPLPIPSSGCRSAAVEADKREAARARFLARKTAAARSQNDG